MNGSVVPMPEELPPGSVESGSRLRYGDPWADPVSERDPVRRMRGRLPAPVTVWTAGDTEWAGLTVSSVLLAQGEPPWLMGLVGPDTDLADAVAETGTFVVHVLGGDHRRLAQHFAGMLPAPDDQLVVRASPHGPVLVAVTDRLACRVIDQRPAGWSLAIDAVIEQVELGPGGQGLAWYRGGFDVVAPPAR